MENKQYIRECPEGLQKVYAFFGNRKTCLVGCWAIGLMIIGLYLLCSIVFDLSNDLAGFISMIPLLPPVIFWGYQEDQLSKLKLQLLKDESLSPKSHYVKHKYDPAENKLIFNIVER